MSSRCSITLAERFAADGVVFPLDGISPGDARACRAALERFERDPDPRIDGSWRARLFELHLLLTEFDRLVRAPRVLDAVAGILGPDLLVWECNVFAKDPGSESFVSWHQDLHYLGLDSEDQVNAWFALTDVSEKNGCMRMIPGSHLGGGVAHRDTWAKSNVLTRGQEVEISIDEACAVNVTMKPGQVSLHHGHMFHASGPNRSDDRRIGVAVRYIRPSARQQLADRDCAVLVRGEDRFGHFDLLDGPASAMDAAAIARFGRARALREAIYFQGVNRPAPGAGGTSRV